MNHRETEMENIKEKLGEETEGTAGTQKSSRRKEKGQKGGRGNIHGDDGQSFFKFQISVNFQVW